MGTLNFRKGKTVKATNIFERGGVVIMTNEDFQSLVLQQLKVLTEGQQEIRGDINTLKQGQHETNKRLDSLETGQKRLELRMENEVIEKVSALFDVREVQSDINQQIINTLRRMEAKIDVLQMETAHIRIAK